MQRVHVILIRHQLSDNDSNFTSPTDVSVKSLLPCTTRGQCGFRFNKAGVCLISLLVVEGGVNRRKFALKALRPYIMLPWVISAPTGTVVTVTVLWEDF